MGLSMPLANLLLQAQHRLGFANRIREGRARKRAFDICRKLGPALGVWRHAGQPCLGELGRDTDIGDEKLRPPSQSPVPS